MKLSGAEIMKRVPHDGRMCLLHQVQSWDETRIVCTAVGHRAPDNPLRDNAMLPALCGVEYAAQAMALHGSLVGMGNKAGLLASLRDVVLAVHRLDDISGELTICAEKLIAEGERVLYQFTILSGSRELVSGRAAVVFAAGKP